MTRRSPSLRQRAPEPPRDASLTSPWRRAARYRCSIIWESQEAFEAFGATLLPILNAAGIELNEPMVARVHNQIAG